MDQAVYLNKQWFEAMVNELACHLNVAPYSSNVPRLAQENGNDTKVEQTFKQISMWKVECSYSYQCERILTSLNVNDLLLRVKLVAANDTGCQGNW